MVKDSSVRGRRIINAFVLLIKGRKVWDDKKFLLGVYYPASSTCQASFNLPASSKFLA